MHKTSTTVLVHGCLPGGEGESNRATEKSTPGSGKVWKTPALLVAIRRRRRLQSHGLSIIATVTYAESGLLTRALRWYVSKPLDRFLPDSGTFIRSQASCLLLFLKRAYSGIVTVPFTLNVPATAGAPVSGWPPPTLTVYSPSATIDLARPSPCSSRAASARTAPLRRARLQMHALKSTQARYAARPPHRETSGTAPPLRRPRRVPVFVTVASTVDRVSRFHSVRRNLQLAVRELRVAQPVSERIERRSA